MAADACAGINPRRVFGGARAHVRCDSRAAFIDNPCGGLGEKNFGRSRREHRARLLACVFIWNALARKYNLSQLSRRNIDTLSCTTLWQCVPVHATACFYG